MKSKKSKVKGVTEDYFERGDIVEGFAKVKSLLATNPQNALDLALRILPLAKKNGELSLVSENYFWIASSNNNLSNYDLAHKHLKVALSLALRCGDRLIQCRAMSGLGNLMVAKGKIKEGIIMSEKALSIARRLSNPELEIDVLFNSSNNYKRVGNHDGAVSLLIESLKIATTTSNLPMQGKLFNGLGRIANEYHDSINGREYFRKALAISRQLKSFYIETIALGGIGFANFNEKAFKESLEWGLEALKIARQFGDKSWISRALRLIGASYYELAEYEHATDTLLEAISYHDSTNYEGEWQLYQTKAFLAKTYYKLGKLEPSREILDEIELKSNTAWDANGKTGMYKYLAELHAFHKNFEKAYIYTVRMSEHEEQITSTKARNDISNLRVFLKLEREKHEQNIQKLHTKSLEDKISAQAVQLATQTDLLAKFRDELREITRKYPSDNPGMREVKDKLKELPCKQIDWEKFDAEFRAVHPEFTKKLYEQFPALTPTETKMCSLLRLNLKSHEIARLFCLSERSVETHRFNIRKKLKIGHEQNLVTFLNSL
jgi:tetratricopeptide (TPR) repeat protein/DNA-binding CsgD family transcriptional regulator